MAEPTLIQQQRKLLRTFREVTAKRIEAETEAKARLEQEQEAIKATLEQAAAQRSQTEEEAKARFEQQQQEAKNTLKQAAAQRDKAKTQAKAHFEQEQQAAEAERKEAAGIVANKLIAIRQAPNKARQYLTKVGKSSILDETLEQVSFSFIASTSVRDPLVELDNYIIQLYRLDLQPVVGDLQAWRDKQAALHREQMEEQQRLRIKQARRRLFSRVAVAMAIFLVVIAFVGYRLWLG